MAGEDPLAAEHLVEHVKDATYFEVPRFFQAFDIFGLVEVHGSSAHLKIPQWFELSEPIVFRTGFEAVDTLLEPLDLVITKFMILEVLAAVILAAIFVPLAGRVATAEAPRGRFWNLFEAMLLFIRDQMARPAIGKGDADRYLPFLWTLFFFILVCNLLGLVPWMGSPTGAIAATGALAFITFCTVIGSGMRKFGVGRFWALQVPHMDVPTALAVLLKPMIFVVEVFGLLIRHFVLAVRLLANMMAGHLVLAVMLAFIAASAPSLAVYGVAPASVFGAFAVNLLELFVAFLQAYIFVFLAALFIGMAVHPH